MAFIPDFNEVVTCRLKTMLHAVNPFIRLFPRGAERLQTYPDLNLRIVFLDPDRRRNRKYNHPTGNEVGGIMLDDGSATTHERDIVIQRRGAPFLERNACPCSIRCLFHRDDLGWHNAIVLSGPNARSPRAPARNGDEDVDEEEVLTERAGCKTFGAMVRPSLF